MRLGLPVGALLLTLGLAVEARAADAYKIDTGHSAVVFKVKHFNVGYTYGMFRQFGGMFALDAAAPAKSSVKLEIEAASVYTANKKRDKHLQGPDFFNAKLYPKIGFVSTKVKRAGKRWHVTGKLTLHGTSKTVTVKLVQTGAGKDPYGNHRVGFEGALKIKRSQYGMSKMIGPASDEIQLMLSFEGIKQ